LVDISSGVFAIYEGPEPFSLKVIATLAQMALGGKAPPVGPASKMISSMDVAVMVLMGPDLNCTIANPPCCALLSRFSGRPVTEVDLVGKRLLEITPLTKDHRLERATREAGTANSPVFLDAVAIPTDSGEPLRFSSLCCPITDRAGRPSGVAVIALPADGHGAGAGGDENGRLVMGQLATVA
jgi:hypothetical protein